MKYRSFGRIETRVSALSFGCMRLALGDGYRERVPLATKSPVWQIVPSAA